MFSLPLLAFSGCDYFTANAINNYLADIAEIQQDSNLALMDLNQHVSSLSGDPEQIEEAITGLENSLVTIGDARKKINALDVPEDALELHGDLLELYSTGHSVVNDLITTGRYQLEMEPILAQYNAASSNFNDSLQAAADSSILLAAMRTYQAAIESISERAESLVPPTIATNSHKRFLTNLQTLRAGITEMIAAVEQNDVGAVEAASQKMSSVSAGDEQLEKDMLADLEADVRAYNAQIMEMSALTQKIKEDQAALRNRFETD